MQTLLTFTNLNYHRFRAVDGAKLFTNTSTSYLSTFNHSSNIRLDFTSRTMELNKSPMRSGEIGCWLSYLFLMREFAEKQYSQPLVILEDDIDIDVNFSRYIQHTIDSAPADWDILLCGYCCLIATNYKSETLRSAKSYYATHCFIIRNASTAARIANRLDVERITSPVDRYFSRLAAHK